MTRTRTFRLLAATAALAGLLGLGACQQMQDNPRQTVGAVLGGAAGAVIGAQFGSGTGQLAATAAGTLLGAYIGSEIGRTMDTVDRQQAAQAVQRAHVAPVGEPVYWSNPDSGNHGSVTAVRDGRQAGSNAYCREYETTVVVDGRSETAYGVACQQADGTWVVQE